MTNRPTLRAHYRSLRQHLDAACRTHKSERINRRLEALPILNTAQRIAAYLASPEEAWIGAFINFAWQRQQSIFLPCIKEERGHMIFVKQDPNAELQRNRFGLLEPADQSTPARASELDCALVPLVAFDERGSRLGMGGGYYDRFFSDPTERPTLIGIAFSEQQTPSLLPREGWDVPLDMVVTDEAFRQFH